MTFRNKLGGAIAALVLLASAAWGIVWFVVSHKLEKGVFETGLSRNLGINIKIDKLSLDWRGRIQFDQLQLSTSSGQSLGTIKQAVANVEVTPLLQGRVEITHLSLDQLNLLLSNAIVRELDNLPKATKLRTYPIDLSQSTVEWHTTSKESYRLGPLSAHSPPQKLPLQNDYVALLGGKSLLNVTLVEGNADFQFDTTGGDGLPPAWAEALKAEDHLRVGGAWKAGQLQVDGQLTTSQVEAPFHLEWAASKPEQILCQSSAVKFGGSFLGPLDLRLNISDPQQIGVEIEGKLPRPWHAQGHVGHDGATRLQLTSRFDLDPGRIKVEAQITKAMGQAPLVIQGQALLSQARLGSRTIPDLLLWIGGQARGDGFQGECKLSLGSEHLAAGQLRWANKVGWTANLTTVALNPELLDGFPLEGSLKADASWPPGKPALINVKATRLWLAHQLVTDLQASITPQQTLAAGTCKFEKSPQPLKFNIQPGKFTVEGRQLALPLPGVLAGKFDVSIEGSPETGPASANFSAIKLTYAGKPLPELATNWKREKAGSPWWRCESLQTPKQKLDSRSLLFNLDTLQMQGKLKIPALQLAELEKLSGSKADIEGSLLGTVELKNHNVKFRGRIDNFKTPAWHSPRLNVLADLQIPQRKAQPWTYSVRGSDSQFSLPPASGLQGKGQLSLLASSANPQPRLEMNIPKLSMAGTPPVQLGPFLAQASLRKDGSKVGSMSIQLPNLATHLKGLIQPDRVDLKGSVDGLNLALLSNKKVTGKVVGKVSVQGKMADAKVQFKGEAQSVVAGGHRFPTFPINFDQQGKKSTFDIPQLGLSGLPGVTGKARVLYTREGEKKEFRLTAPELSYRGKALPALQATSADLKKVTIDLKPATGKPWKIEGEVSPKVSFKTHLDKVDVALFRAALPSLPEVTGNLSGDAKFVSGEHDYLLSFNGSASELSHPKSRIGSAVVRLEANTDMSSVTRLSVDVSEISANQVGALGLRYPGFTGQISLHVEGIPSNLQGSLRLDKARFRQEDFPGLVAAFILKQDILTINPLEVACQPPLKVTGQLGMKDNSLRIYTELEGQSIAQLSKLLGLTPNSEVQGNMHGPLYLEGTTASPQLRFKGSVSEMVVRGVSVGQSALEVQAAQSLKGQLTFAQPIDGAAFGKTGGIRGLVRVAGARLGGTPSQPTIDPILMGPQIQVTGGQGGPGIKIGDFRLPISLPSIRR